MAWDDWDLRLLKLRFTTLVQLKSQELKSLFLSLGFKVSMSYISSPPKFTKNLKATSKRARSFDQVVQIHLAGLWGCCVLTKQVNPCHKGLTRSQIGP